MSFTVSDLATEAGVGRSKLYHDLKPSSMHPLPI